MAARTKISFATCNLFNLNLPGHSIYKDSDGWSQNEYDAKIDWLSRMLKTVDAVYWGFQELWHQDALEAAFQRAGLTQSYRLLVPPNHSGGLGYAISTIRRTAEAAALRMIIVDLMKGSDIPVVVLGDLNDDQRSNTLNVVTGQPNYLVSALSQGGGDADLYTVGTLQEYRSLRDVYYTHIHQNQQESLDHILVSQEFYDNARKRIWAFKGMKVYNDHLNQDDHKITGTSDHAIVKATFEYRPNR